MKLIWLGYFIQIGILTLAKPFIVDFQSTAILAVLVHVIFTMIVLYLNRKRSLFLINAFIVRVIFLFWDLYGRKIFILPNSGADSEMYYRNAVSISEQLSLLGTTRGGPFSDINGILFHLIGPQRMFGQYMNVLLGISVIVIIYRIFGLLEINKKVMNLIILVISFFPNSIIMSSIFIREAFPTFFVALSLYYFIKWFKSTKIKYMIYSFIMLGIASLFHSGVIGITLGYIFAFLFYKERENKFKFNGKTVVSFIIVLILFSLAFTFFDDLLFRKFQKVEGIEDIYQTATSDGSGGSAYLIGLEINNFFQFIVFSPIKSIYFLASPLPMDWRGVMDVFSFFTDSMLYLGTILYFIKNRKKLGDRKALAISIIVMIIGASFIFGVGVSNAGTAMRHRQKLIPIFLVLFGIMMNEKIKNEKTENIEN